MNAGKRATRGSVNLTFSGANLPARLTGLSYGIAFTAASGQQRVLAETLGGSEPMGGRASGYEYLSSEKGQAVITAVRDGVR